jgi:hypothetical protein
MGIVVTGDMFWGLSYYDLIRLYRKVEEGRKKASEAYKKK